MQYTTKMCTRLAIIFLVLSIVVAITPWAYAAPAITLNTNAQAPGGTVIVTGTGFGTTKPIGIGLGAEVNASAEAHPITNTTGPGPFMTRTNRYPLKPGSFSFHCVVSSETNVVESDYIDNGDGTLTTDSTYSVNHTVNYATGVFGRGSTSDWSTFTVVYTAKYTSYQYNVTSAGGVNTSPAGTFTATITVPVGVANGNYNVTAIDTQGNKATAVLNVDSTIPEGISIEIVALLSTLALAVCYRFLRKKPSVQTYSLNRLAK